MLVVPHASLCEGRSNYGKYGIDSASHRGEQITAAAVLGDVKLQLAEAMKTLKGRTACLLLRVLCGSRNRILNHAKIAYQHACGLQIYVTLLAMQAGQEIKCWLGDLAPYARRC